MVLMNEVRLAWFLREVAVELDTVLWQQFLKGRKTGQCYNWRTVGANI